MENEKIGNIQAIALVVISTMCTVFMSVKQLIIADCASSSLINVVYVFAIALILTLVFCTLSKKFSGKSILDISYFLGGRVLEFIVGIIFIAYFVLTAAILLKKLCSCLQIVYYPMTNIKFILLPFAIATTIIVYFKRDSSFKASVIIFPLLILVICLIFIGNIKNFDINSIYPILGNGINSTFLYGATNLYVFNAISYLYFLPPKLREPKKFKFIAFISITISAILLFLIVANLLFTFGYNLSSTELFPLYLSVRYIEFGTFFQRLDAIFLSFCVLNFICFLCLNTTVCIGIFKQITHLSDKHLVIFPHVATLIGFSMLIKSIPKLLIWESSISKWFFFLITIGLTFIILVSARIKLKLSRR